MASRVSAQGGLPRALLVTRFASETQAVCVHLSDVRVLEEQKGAVYRQGLFEEGSQSWMVGVAEIGVQGPESTKEVRRAISFFRPQIILFVGVAKAYRQVNVGDIVVGTRVFGVLTGKLGRDFYPRQEEYRPSDLLLEYVREEAEGLSWLRFVEGELSEQTPRVLLGPVAAGDVTLSVVDTPKFPMLLRPPEEPCAVSSSEIHFFQSAFLNNNKALLIQGVESQHGLSATPEDQQTAMAYACAFAFQLLSQMAPSVIHPRASVELSVSVTWMAALIAIVLGVLSSMPLFCVRQFPYVKEVGLGHWQVSLGPRQISRDKEPLWLVTTGTSAVPIALLKVGDVYVDGFYQATPIYWNPQQEGEQNPAKWALKPWHQVDPPEPLHSHPWLMLKSRADGSLTFPHLSPHVPRRGRALVYLSFERKDPVGEIEFILGPLLTIRRLYWDWRKLSENFGPWALRLKGSDVATPLSLRKHRWPPVLQIQRERVQNKSRWRFTDMVPGLLWPGSQWIAFLPETGELAQVPFGWVQLEPGEERWVKELRMPWSSFALHRKLVVRYFDPNREETPDFRHFGEISSLCEGSHVHDDILGRCVVANVGSEVGAGTGTWYVVLGEKSVTAKSGIRWWPARGYVRLDRVSAKTSAGQVFLWRNKTIPAGIPLVLLSPQQQKQHALQLCKKTRKGMRKILRMSSYDLQKSMWKESYQRWEEQLLLAMILAAPGESKVWSFPATGSVLRRCWQDVTRLQQGIFSKGNQLDWSYRWRDVSAIMKTQPQQAFLLLQRICDDAPRPQSRSMCNRRLLRLWPKVLLRPKNSKVPEDWAKRLRVELSQDACFSLQSEKNANLLSAWLDVERMLRIQDKIPFDPKYCEQRRIRKERVSVGVLYWPLQGALRSRGDVFLLGWYWSRQLSQTLWREWNAHGLEGKPRLRWMEVPESLLLSAPSGWPESLDKQPLWKRWMRQHGFSLVWIHTLRQGKQGYELGLQRVMWDGWAGVRAGGKEPSLRMSGGPTYWQMGAWRALITPSVGMMTPLWRDLLRLQNRPVLSKPRSFPTTRAVLRRDGGPGKQPISGQPKKFQPYSAQPRSQGITGREIPSLARTATPVQSTTQPTTRAVRSGDKPR